MKAVYKNQYLDSNIEPHGVVFHYKKNYVIQILLLYRTCIEHVVIKNMDCCFDFLKIK